MTQSAVKGADQSVTVVVASKNAAGKIRGCLESVIAQKGAQPELLVIDGASTDGTREILASFGRRHLSYVSEPDSGVYSAWNKGVRLSRGEWICFLGADDRFHDRDSLAKLLARARVAPPTTVVYGKLNLLASNGVVAQTIGRPWAACRQDFLCGVMIPHPGTLHHRSLFVRNGLFDETFRIAGDYEFLLRELQHADPGFVDDVVVDMALGGLSVRPQNIQIGVAEVKSARQRHGLHDDPWTLRRTLWAARIGAGLHRVCGDRVFRIAADAYRRIRGRPRIWTE